MLPDSKNLDEKASQHVSMDNENEPVRIRPALKKKMLKVEELLNLSKKYNTIAFVSAIKTPTKIIQKLKKQLGTRAHMLMVQQAVLKRVIDTFSSSNNINQNIVDELRKVIVEPSYVLFTNMSPTELYSVIANCRERVYASAGTVANEDIIIEKGATDLQPGPVLTELKSAGLDVMIDKGKIAIKSDKIVTKKGEKITKSVANVLRLLNIKPLEIFAEYKGSVCSGLFFTKSLLEMYIPSSIDKHITSSVSQTINLAVNAVYYSSVSVDHIISSAVLQARSLGLETGFVSPTNIDVLLFGGMQQAEVISNYVKKNEGELK